MRTHFDILRREKLYCHLTKCHFGQSEVKFLGHTISAKGLAVDTRKTEAIAKWPTPVNQKQRQSFLGLAGYYRRFIRDYATLALPLGPLIKKEHVWTWGPEQTRAFEEIKSSLQKAPVLKLPDHEKRFIVTTNASGCCVGDELAQVQAGKDHPLAFFLKKRVRMRSTGRRMKRNSSQSSQRWRSDVITCMVVNLIFSRTTARGSGSYTTREFRPSWLAF